MCQECLAKFCINFGGVWDYSGQTDLLDYLKDFHKIRIESESKSNMMTEITKTNHISVQTCFEVVS